MSGIEILFLAIALSVDACVVSFSYGLAFNKSRLKVALSLASVTGIFQGIMPIGGYFLADVIKSYIAPFAKFIIFFIFMYLGIKFIKESFDNKSNKNLCIGLSCLLMIGIATSIDAFSAGISLLLAGNNIIKPALLIGIITFINSLSGFYLGQNLKKFSTKSMEIFAGTILILLAIKAIL